MDSVLTAAERVIGTAGHQPVVSDQGEEPGLPPPDLEAPVNPVETAPVLRPREVLPPAEPPTRQPAENGALRPAPPAPEERTSLVPPLHAFRADEEPAPAHARVEHPIAAAPIEIHPDSCRRGFASPSVSNARAGPTGTSGALVVRGLDGCSRGKSSPPSERSSQARRTATASRCRCSHGCRILLEIKRREKYRIDRIDARAGGFCGAVWPASLE